MIRDGAIPTGAVLPGELELGRRDVTDPDVLALEWNGVHRQQTIEVGERRQRVLVEFPASAELR